MPLSHKVMKGEFHRIELGRNITTLNLKHRKKSIKRGNMLIKQRNDEKNSRRALSNSS